MVVPAGNVDLNVVLRILYENVLPKEGLRAKLVASLKAAKKDAKANLNKDTYDYFHFVYGPCGWPTTVIGYMDYVRKYMTQVPVATRTKKWNYIMERVLKSPKKWKQRHKGVYEVYQNCVYNELVHFCWLINQKVDHGRTLQANKLFESWVRVFCMGNGVFLNTPESLTKESLKSFEDDPEYHYDWYNEHEAEWMCFNDFFCRQFNQTDSVTGLSLLRPVNPDPSIITSPADCTFMQMYSIDDKGNLILPDGNPASYILKDFTRGCRVQDLLTDQCRPFWEDYYGGTFIHYFLSPYDYHRFHVPVAGLVVAVETIVGQCYVDVVIKDDGEFDAPDDAENGFEFRQDRGLIIVENELLGKVATLPIGMSQVSGVHMYKDQLLYREVVKGQEFGYFLFGGSDIVMVIPKAAGEVNFITQGQDKQPKVFQYGEAAAVKK